MDGLVIDGLTVDFGNFKLDGINLNIRKGCVTGLVGRNGAGKSTLIKTIMRQQDAVSGGIFYGGLKFAENEEKIFGRLSCVFDYPQFSTSMKPKKVSATFKALYGGFDTEKYDKLMEKFKLPHNLKLNKYSFGMLKKYCLILALCRDSEYLILDEPTSGIDPFDRNEIVELIQEYMLDENHTTLFSTHITEDLDRIADYVVIMDDGKIVLDCDKETLTENYRLVQCAEMTEEMKACAIGVRKSMFGYTFLTTNKNFSGAGVQIKTPTIEEIFVHTTGASGEYGREGL